MSKPKPETSPTPPGVALPNDTTDILRLHVDLCESRQARASIVSILEERGQLFTGPNGVGQLASRRMYLDALELFCTRAGLAPEALNEGRATRLDQEREQRRQEQHRASQLREMTKVRK